MQMSLQLPERLSSLAKTYAEKHGYANLQELIRELIREKIFEPDEKLSGVNTYLASQASLAKAWNSPREDAAWAHLQEKT